jgi:hypothetical protein
VKRLRILDSRVRVNDGVLEPLPHVKTDLAQPYYGLSEDPQATATVAPPPETDETVQHIVEILLAAYALDKTAKLMAGVVPGIPENIFAAAIANSGGMKGHTAHARLNRLELEPGIGADIAKAAARREIYYRAAYILNAAHRIHDDVRSGVKVERALKSEREIFRSHEAARNGRMLAAERVGVAAQQFGPLLGWYLNPLLNNERECIAANGHNFRADQGTVIGLPGSVHPNCGCTAGPPIEGAGMVNAAIAGDGGVIFQAPRRYRTKAS